jgi:putative membrane protein
MDKKAVAGIFLLGIALIGLVLFFPIYSPSSYGGWGCPVIGTHRQGGMMGMMRQTGNVQSGFLYSNLGSIILFDTIFIAILLLGIYLIWKSTQTRSLEAPKPSDRSLEILKERYTKGEITKEEYDRIKREL